MPRVKNYRVYLSADDVVDTQIRLAGPDVMAFAVNYRACLGGVWVEVVRYDTSHDHAHVHLFWLGGQDRTRPLEKRGSYEECLEFARQDLKANWRLYRARMEVSN